MTLEYDNSNILDVTILILIDGFLQSTLSYFLLATCLRHNPYFNRWFSAIYVPLIGTEVIDDVTILILIDGFLQSVEVFNMNLEDFSHNPYFNRWFSAIKNKKIRQRVQRQEHRPPEVSGTGAGY